MKPEVFVVCDRNVEQFARKIAGDRPLLSITADEDHKNIESVLSICRWLLEQSAGRSALVYAVGGGITTDMVGFAASIYKRGVKYVNYPTTLLSQVDAGIGGKTGVNLDGYKNMLGVTKFPCDVRIFPEVLETLPERELRAGAAELLKTFIIGSSSDYERAVEVLSKDKTDLRDLSPLIKKAAAIKSEIVEKDPFEEDIRRHLNLGHTYAHAIEWYQHTHGVAAPLNHGEAVAVGIIKAAQISEKLNIAPRGLEQRLRRDFSSCGLPVDFPCNEKDLFPALSKDKKTESGIIHFVVIKKIGKVSIVDIDDLHKYSE